MQTQDISILNLAVGLLLILIPAFILYHYKTNLLKSLAISVTRMVVQLFMVGFYLKYLFDWDNTWINIAWLLIMIGVCTLDLLNRVRISFKLLFIPVYFAISISLVFVGVYFLKAVLCLDNLFESRYFIPICGILLGNILSSNVIGLNAFYSGLVREQQMYNYLLCNGATINEAIKPFIRTALIKSFNPTIASMAVMGLIALPGTLVGQIMGGSSPDTAIRYQIMIMVIVLTSSIITLLISLLWSTKYTFDKYDRLRNNVVK